jgi:hypothetical protein
MHSTPVHLSKKRFWPFLAVLSIAAILLAGIATSRYGAGVSSDATKYLSVAQNLLDGNGLYDHKGAPLLAWPPLYSLILTGLSLLSSLDVFVAGWYFNIFLLGMNVFLSGIILYRSFPEKPLYAYLGSVFVFLSISSLRIHANISSDPFYLTLTLGFLAAVHGYVTRRSYTAFAWMLVFSALAPLQRYVGMAVAVTAAVVLLIENRSSIRTLVRDGLMLGLASVLPIGWWILVHNILTYGSLWGVGHQVIDAGANTSLALTKMLHWFVPYFSFLMPVLTRPILPLGVLAALIFLINRRSRENGRAWVRCFAAPAVYPTMVYALIYFLALSLTVVTADHRDLFSDRYYVILLVPTAMLMLFTFDTLVLPHLHGSLRQGQIALLLLFGLWAVYPFYSFTEYLREARELGEPSGANMFNNRTYREMDLVAEMQRIRREQPETPIYSNYSDAVWFYTRKPVIPSLIVTEEQEISYTNWPFQAGYLVWFEPNEYKHYLAPEKIGELANMELIFDGEGGKIYYVQAH